MRNLLVLPLFCLWAAGMARAQQGPFPVDAWPPTVNQTVNVQYVSVGDKLAAPNDKWLPNLSILTGGDQLTDDIEIGGFPGKKVTGNYLNVADLNEGYTQWADQDTIDVLMQVYGDAAVLNSAGQPRNFNFLLGTLPELTAPVGGQIPVEAKNAKWNWVLFRVPNGTRPSDGSRYVGSIPANAQGATVNAGVNGGTIRLEGVPNLIVRAIAWGPLGAFGEPESVNLFSAPESCDPEPNTNHAWADIAANTSSHIQVLNNGDQPSVIETGVGPVGDRRRAVRATGTYLNFAITDNYFGKPCNDPRTVKVCVEYYDDPAAKDVVSFGPEALATDAVNGIGFYPESGRQTLKGSGKWERRSWVVPSVNLRGVNTAPLTGGPRFIFTGGSVAISRVDIAILRVGTHPLAGQDPLADCFSDPNICLGIYGDFAEMDLAKGIFDGLTPGNSGGDQEMIQEEAGPANDRRLAIRPAMEDGSPAFRHIYLNFGITDEKLGPNSQPNARLAICATYYDDPALVGTNFRPEVYQSERNGTVTLAFTGGNSAVVLEGSGTWRDAYFELPDVKFNGVNQGPQAAARFALTGKIPITRLRYAVIRPCGPNKDKNLLEACKPVTSPTLRAERLAGGRVRLAWPAAATGFGLESTAILGGVWQPVVAAPSVDGTSLVIEVSADGAGRFYRLVKP